MENRILIVDDDERICAIIARRLVKEGFPCVIASDGREALNHFYKGSISVVISDIKMPGLNGIELLKNVKALDQNMVVIMITAYPEVDLAVEAVRQGAYDFIIKPFDLDLVVFSVKKALEKRRLEEEIDHYRRHADTSKQRKGPGQGQVEQLLKKAHLNTIGVLIEAIDTRDPYTRGHSDRVRNISLKIAEKLDFDKKRLERLEYGALLHDIGKLGIRDEVLQKQGPLNPEEYHHIQEHPLIGIKMIEGIDFFRDEIPMIRHHHERFDGKGYPDGLAGEDIPIEARIIAVSDAFDAMTSDRPYRRRMTFEDTVAEMRNLMCEQFDPCILDIFLSENLDESPVKYFAVGRAESAHPPVLM